MPEFFDVNNNRNKLKLFYSYSHKDEELMEDLKKHLSVLRRESFIGWHDRKISAGSHWDDVISQEIELADIILLLVSVDFLDSDYIRKKEMERALHRHNNGEATVIPIILKPCDWKATPLSTLEALPKDGIPIVTWENIDEGFLDTVQGIRKVIDSMLKKAKARPETGRIEQEEQLKEIKITVESQEIVFYHVKRETAKQNDNGDFYIAEMVLPQKKVNWNDANRIIEILNKQMRNEGSIYNLRMPRKSEWRYAYRNQNTITGKESGLYFNHEISEWCEDISQSNTTKRIRFTPKGKYPQPIPTFPDGEKAGIRLIVEEKNNINGKH